MTKKEGKIDNQEQDLRGEERIEPEISREKEEDDPILKFKETIEEKENQIQELSTRLTRLQADFQNFKRRTEKDREQSIAYGIEAIVLDLLPVIDNFQRAMEAQEDKDDGFYKGVSMIKKQLAEVLEKNLVQEIETYKKEFDPNLHDAVSTMDSEELSGTIIEVLRKGYIYKGKVIRPSMVIVAK